MVRVRVAGKTFIFCLGCFTVFCVFCVFIVLSVHFLSSSCLLFVSSGFCIWASLPEINDGMEWKTV